MAVKLSSLAVTPSADGTWEVCKTIPEVSFLVRPISTPAFAIARDHHVQRLRRKHGESIPPDVMSVALGRLAAEHLLLDWKGFDEDYSPERAEELLSNPEYSELVSGVIACAISAGEAKIEYIKGAAKN